MPNKKGAKNDPELSERWNVFFAMKGISPRPKTDTLEGMSEYNKWYLDVTKRHGFKLKELHREFHEWNAEWLHAKNLDYWRKQKRQQKLKKKNMKPIAKPRSWLSLGYPTNPDDYPPPDWL